MRTPARTTDLSKPRAPDVFDAGGTNDPNEQFLVVVAAPGATGDPAFKAAVEDLVEAHGAGVDIDGVRRRLDQLADPFPAPPGSRLTPPTSAAGSCPRPGRQGSGRCAVAPILPIRRGTRPTRGSHPRGSATFINDDINSLISHDLDSSIVLTIPATFIILIVAFGAVAASVVPLVLALTSLLAAFGILGIFSQVVEPVSPNAVQLIVLIGLAVAIDYSLFMITRFRVERRAGRPRDKAIEVSSSTAGRAVFFSGLAVMISLAGLITLGISLFTSMAIGTISVVLVSVIGSLTFLPATLSILGDRVNVGRPAAWLPRLAAFLPLGPISRWGRNALAWLTSGRRARRQRVLGARPR
jgi:RND superfamily putative drug exporter